MDYRIWYRDAHSNGGRHLIEVQPRTPTTVGPQCRPGDHPIDRLKRSAVEPRATALSMRSVQDGGESQMAATERLDTGSRIDGPVL